MSEEWTEVPGEWDRLHRIEEAARAAAVAYSRGYQTEEQFESMNVLRAALEDQDVPRVTEAERAEAQRVREVIAEDNSPR